MADHLGVGMSELGHDHPRRNPSVHARAAKIVLQIVESTILEASLARIHFRKLVLNLRDDFPDKNVPHRVWFQTTTSWTEKYILVIL